MNNGLLLEAVRYADQWLEYQQKLREIPAVAVAVRQGTDLVLSAAYGHANLATGTPVIPNHIFRVASHSKWFTATAILQLQEQGRLRLDDSLGQYIGWLQGPLSTVTIRQTLNHAAGITRDGYDNDHWQLLHAFPDRTQLETLVSNQGNVLPPNSMLKYSNIGYSLLGEVVASAAQVPYNDYVRTHIVERLGLTGTGPETEERIRPRLVTGYTSRGLLLPRFPLPDVATGAMSAATGFYSTAEDLTTFAAAHYFGNDTLLSDESKREMQRAYWQVEDMDSYGLGMQVITIGERTMVGHSGGFPGHTTRTLLDPHDQLALSVLTSETGGVASLLLQSVVKLIDLALKQPDPNGTAELERYTGRFAGLWGFRDIVSFGQQLFLCDPEEDDPAGGAVKLEVVDADTLRLAEKAGYGSPGEPVRFLRGDNGTVERVIIAGATHVSLAAAPEYLQQQQAELTARST